MVTLFEVGPRDGLQNEKKKISLATRLKWIEGLRDAGLHDIEVGLFVRPDRVPQMADSAKIFESLQKKNTSQKSTRYWALVPNLKGLERATAAGAQNLAVFTAASESFAQRNIGMSISESLKIFKEVINEGRKSGKQFRGYLSTAFFCPFEGAISPNQAIKWVEKLLDLGVFQVSIGDTIGKATPVHVEKVIGPLLKKYSHEKIAVHFHDTWGTALANALRAYQMGVRVFDSSAGGLGGCPFAPGATGNLATEDLVFLFEGMGISTGINFKKLCQSSLRLAKTMKRPLTSSSLKAYAASVLK